MKHFSNAMGEESKEPLLNETPLTDSSMTSITEEPTELDKLKVRR